MSERDPFCPCPIWDYVDSFDGQYLQKWYLLNAWVFHVEFSRASGHCYELRVASAHRVFFSRVSAWNHFLDRCLVVPWQAPGREALCCPGCPEAESGSNWSRAMQEADWRAAVFIPQQFLCVYSAVFLGSTRTYGRTWAPCLTLYLISQNVIFHGFF